MGGGRRVVYQQDRGQWPRGLAGFDRIWASHPTGGLGVLSGKEREAIAPFVRDDELLISRYTASRLYLGDADVTVHGLVLYLTDRKLLILTTAKRGFRARVVAETFEYSRLVATMECADEPLPGAMVWLADIDLINGTRHVLNFYRSDQRDAFAEQFESEASSWHAESQATGRATGNLIQFDPKGPEQALEEAMDAVAQRSQDYAKAFECCVKAVDRLHDHYIHGRFRARQPSAADEEIIQALVRSLRFRRRDEPHRDIRDGVVEATHRLRTISTAVDRSGGDSGLYRWGLTGLAEVAPDVDVGEVLWS